MARQARRRNAKLARNAYSDKPGKGDSRLDRTDMIRELRYELDCIDEAIKALTSLVIIRRGSYSELIEPGGEGSKSKR